MSTTTHLKEIVGSIRALSESLNVLASKLEERMPETSKKEEKKPELTLSDVRAVLAKKSQAGFTKDIKALLQKHGAEKLSSVEPKHYKSLLQEVEELK